MQKSFEKNKGGFTLIELLVVIAIISLLSSVVLASLSSAQESARDARRKQDLKQLQTAVELYYNDTGHYPATDGWIQSGQRIDDELVPEYMSTLPKPPSGNQWYLYYRKDYGSGCYPNNGSAQRYVFYTKLENPSSKDLATIDDAFDDCVANNVGANYAVGN